MQHFALIPVVGQLKVRGSLRHTTRIEPARGLIDIHRSGYLLFRELACFWRAILNSTRPGNFRVPQRRTGSHEQRVHDVARVRQYHRVKVEQP